MLTINQIIRCCQKRLDIRFKRKPHPFGRTGEYDSDGEDDAPEIIIYPTSTNFERDITILHEFIHARDDLLHKKSKSKTGARREFSSTREREAEEEARYEERVEYEARETYKKRPESLRFIKELYRIK